MQLTLLSVHLLGLITAILASPIHPPPRRILSIPLAKRSSFIAPRRAEERVAQLEAGVQAVYSKYGVSTGLSKRAGEVLLADLMSDIQYYGQVHVGTPPTAYNVIVDTGSSDFLLATSPCETGCEPVTPIYHPSLSSSAVTSSHDFQVTYGTGSAKGVLVADTVSFGGFTLEDQTFAACHNLSGILQDDISGLLGLGWQSLATSDAVPFVQRLWEQGRLEQPVFGFAFARWNGNSTAINQPMPGGLLTIGDVNDDLFEGELNWMPSTQSYWQVELQSMSVMGTVLDISVEQVTVDTGTSLIGAPLEAVEAIYAQIPGSERYSDTFYSFPCSTDVRLSFTFGNVTYPMDTRDFNNGATTSSGPGNERCIGAVFVLSDMHGKGRWIFGDAFLKNVYSAFRFDPPSVGFAPIAVSDKRLQTLGEVPTSNATLLREGGRLAAIESSAVGRGRVREALLVVVVGVGVWLL